MKFPVRVDMLEWNAYTYFIEADTPEEAECKAKELPPKQLTQYQRELIATAVESTDTQQIVTSKYYFA